MDKEKIRSYGFEVRGHTGHCFCKDLGGGMSLTGSYQERIDDYFLTLLFNSKERPAKIEELERAINEEIDRELGEENPLSPIRRIQTAAKLKAGIPPEVNLGDGYETSPISLNVEGKNFDELYSRMRTAMQVLGIEM